jgi:hypothetical protein
MKTGRRPTYIREIRCQKQDAFSVHAAILSKKSKWLILIRTAAIIKMKSGKGYSIGVHIHSQCVVCYFG